MAAFPNDGVGLPADYTQLPSIKIHSPLAIVGAFLYIVRSRFQPEYELNWKWLDNKDDTGILIETQYEPNVDAQDVRPAIYIDRDQTTLGQIAVGNRDQNQPGILTQRHEHFWAISQTDLLIDCVSPNKGESAQIADIVQTSLHMSQKVISAVFTFRSISPMMMGRTVPYERQTNLFNTPITFRVEHEVRWSTIPAAPVLQKLGITLSQSQDGVNSQLEQYGLGGPLPIVL